jgi:hypothetical protein
MYNKIYDFCKVRNEGTIYDNNSQTPPPRVQFLMDLLDSEGITYELDKFYTAEVTGYNLILQGTSNRMVVAHHDVSNPNIDNANDNSASVINAMMIKKLLPTMNVILLDGEEVGGIGSNRVSEQINEGKFGDIEWVLNLELSGKGGKHFFIGDYPGPLTNHIKTLFDCPIVRTPFNDSVTFRRNGIDSVVINPLPPVLEGKTNVKWDDETYLDYSMLFHCHSTKDTVATIDTKDMKEFVEDVVLKILTY